MEKQIKTLAVHLHLFYIEQLPEILNHLKCLDGLDLDLFVTMVQKNENAERQIRNFNPNAQIYIIQNKGYDVGPFIDFLHKIDLDSYKYILKIHTKSEISPNQTCLNGYYFNNKLWKNILFDSLLGTRKNVIKKINLLEQNKKIGMLSSKFCITSEKRCYDTLLPQINDVMQRCGFNKVETFHFVAGTMFYVRANLLKPLLRYTIDDFAQTNGSVKDGTFAHVIERIFGALIEAQSYSLYEDKYISIKYYAKLISFSIRRFIFQYKETKHRKLIKIFKIPVYSKKEVK